MCWIDRSPGDNKRMTAYPRFLSSLISPNTEPTIRWVCVSLRGLHACPRWIRFTRACKPTVYRRDSEGLVDSSLDSSFSKFFHKINAGRLQPGFWVIISKWQVHRVNISGVNRGVNITYLGLWHILLIRPHIESNRKSTTDHSSSSLMKKKYRFKVFVHFAVPQI